MVPATHSGERTNVEQRMTPLYHDRGFGPGHMLLAIPDGKAQVKAGRVCQAAVQSARRRRVWIGHYSVQEFEHQDPGFMSLVVADGRRGDCLSRSLAVRPVRCVPRGNSGMNKLLTLAQSARDMR